MKHVKTIALAAIMTMSGASLWAQGLKDAYKNYFDVGVAINSRNLMLFLRQKLAMASARSHLHTPS